MQRTSTPPMANVPVSRRATGAVAEPSAAASASASVGEVRPATHRGPEPGGPAAALPGASSRRLTSGRLIAQQLEALRALECSLEQRMQALGPSEVDSECHSEGLGEGLGEGQGGIEDGEALAWAAAYRGALARLLDTVRAAPEAEVRRSLSLDEHLGLLVEHARACVDDLGGQQDLEAAQQAYLAVWEDPARAGHRREAEFLPCVQAHLARAQSMAQATRDLTTARELVPGVDRVRPSGVDALSQHLEEPVPPNSEPLLRGLTLAATAVAYAEYELVQLRDAAVLDRFQIAPGLLDRVGDVFDHFWQTNILDFADAFTPEAFRRLLSPALTDLREGALDVMAMVIESPVSDAHGADDPVADFVRRTLPLLLQGASQFVALIDLAEPAVARQVDEDDAGSRSVSAITDRGLHVAVRTDAADATQVATSDGRRFSRQADGPWREPDTALDEALKDLRELSEPLFRPSARKLATTSAQRLLDLDLERDLHACFRDAATVFPETLAQRLSLAVQRWTGRATAMEVLGRRLEALDGPAAAAEGRPEGALGRALAERADAVRARLAACPVATLRHEFIKCHARPQAGLWAELLEAGQVRVGLPTPLPGPRPNRLYEIALLPMDGPLADQHQPAVWAHLHLTKPTARQDLRDLTMQDFAAAHLKSDADRRHGATWQARMREWTHQPVQVHRSPLDERLWHLICERLS